MGNRILAIVVATTAGLILAFGSGCNTFKGLGTDLHDVAQNTQVWIEKSAGANTNSLSPSPNSATRYINRDRVSSAKPRARYK